MLSDGPGDCEGREVGDGDPPPKPHTGTRQKTS